MPFSRKTIIAVCSAIGRSAARRPADSLTGGENLTSTGGGRSPSCRVARNLGRSPAADEPPVSCPLVNLFITGRPDSIRAPRLDPLVP